MYVQGCNNHGVVQVGILCVSLLPQFDNYCSEQVKICQHLLAVIFMMLYHQD
jgi:hypothetical protein